MIVYEREHDFIMIEQHNHAILSGQLVVNWNRKYFRGEHRYEDVVYGIAQHDHCWIGLDETPVWNDRDKIPFTFLNYPLIPKIHFYKYGLDQLEKQNPYASLLCSLHFSSFFIGTREPNGIQFLLGEQERQRRLKALCRINHPEEESHLEYHFRLLQFCDDLSLYVCLNEPGSSKEEEHPWFRKGFSNSEIFNEKESLPIVAKWVDEKQISFNFFPFQAPFHAGVRYKAVTKKRIDHEGIAKAYIETKWQNREVTFIPL